VAALALAVLALHLATNGLYDFHRDSLYYLDSARHPAWGYVDYPPITPTVARLSLFLFGPSVWGRRRPAGLGGTHGPTGWLKSKSWKALQSLCEGQA